MLTKPQIVDAIMSVNRSATFEFLMSFDVLDLRRYLEHLQIICEPRGSDSVWVRPADTPAVVTQ